MHEQEFIKLITGTATEAEQKTWYDLMESDPDIKQEYISWLTLWNVSQMERIEYPFPEKQRIFNRFWRNIAPKDRKTRFIHFTPWLQYAAIILVALLSGYLLNTVAPLRPAKPYTSSIQVSAGSISSTVLPDGSLIWLNANTHLDINQQKNKIATDLRGEAYFNVPHDKRREFIVDLGSITVVDLGTEFNICAYPHNELSKITLIKGDIDVKDKNGNLIRNLDEGETLTYNKSTNTFSVDKPDPQLIVGWMEGKFVFVDQTLEDICEELEKWYAITIIIENEKIKKEKFTSVMKRTTTVKSVLEILNVTTKISYTIEENKEGKDIIRLK
jgi:transmembrane sensor